MNAVRFLAMLVGLFPVAGGAEPPWSGWVVADSVEVFEEPDFTGYVTGRIRRGQRVVVRREGPEGWLAIDPPKGSFSWIERQAVEELGEDRARVKVRAAAVRPGSDQARLPGGRWVPVRQGTIVHLLDRPPLILRLQGPGNRSWYAIEPVAGEVRYVRTEGISTVDPNHLPDVEAEAPAGVKRLLEPGGADRRSRRTTRRVDVPPIDASFATVGPPIPERDLTPQFAAELSRVEAAHRAMLQQPLEFWHFETIRNDYQRLRDMSATPEERTAVRLRLDQVARQEAVARAVRELSALVEKSRRLDGQVDAIHGRLADLATSRAAPFDAEGLFFNSSRLIDGRKVYVLIGNRGEVTAYLEVPPGLEASRYLSRRVGVRGEPRYNETAKSRVILVRDLEPLDEAP